MNDKSRKKHTELKHMLHLSLENPIVLAGSIIAISFIIIALLSGLIVNPAAANVMDYTNRICWDNSLINWNISGMRQCAKPHPLGTDPFGRDLLQMIILAIPLDLEIAAAIVFSAFAIGATLGAVAASAGGIIDESIMRVTDVFFAIPGLVLALVLVTIFSHTIFWLTLAVLLTWWPPYVRLTRSQMLSEKEKPYSEALRSVGAGRLRITFLHLLPNSIYPVIVNATLDIGGVILMFSTLMFLGFAPSPLLPELGNLVSLGIENVVTAPWLLIFPGLTIVLIALGFNLMGDGIRDILDPRLRR
jgi:peptide/nickel transport system permease protein